jgi:PD-(D/E)XK nuclease superfamily
VADIGRAIDKSVPWDFANHAGVTKPEPRPVSWSEISTFRQCPHKHQLLYIERWKEPEAGPALRRGILWHELLELWYPNRPNRAMYRGSTAKLRMLEMRLEAHIDTWGDPDSDSDEEIRDINRWMLQGYVEKWGLDPEWEVIEAEKWVEVPLGPYLFRAKIDLLVRIRGHLWVIDHKTASNMPNQREHDLDDQFGLYVWALRQLGLPVLGCIYNVALTRRNKKTPQTLDSRFARHLSNRTDRELDLVAHEAEQTLDRAWGRVKPGELVVRERHTDPETCRWKCQAMTACMAGRRGRDEHAFLRSAGFLQTNRANAQVPQGE